MILQTSRLTLRPLEASDAPALHALMADVEVMAYWDIPIVEDLELTEAILQSQLQDMAAGRALHWAMISTAEVIVKAASTIASAASVAKPLPQASGARA